MTHLHFEDFLEVPAAGPNSGRAPSVASLLERVRRATQALVRLSTMKAWPTDDMLELGFSDAGHFLLASMEDPEVAFPPRSH